MKTLLRFYQCALFLLMSISALAQCPTGDVTFTSQTEVNQFIIDYPSCTEIQGNLLIGDWSGSTGINDISALQNITAVNGELAIANTSLTNVNDLTALTEVNGGLSIYFNPLITSLDGFVNLTTFAGPLAIDDNGVLASLSGIDNIDTTSINYLSLNYNQTLSICNVASICTYLSDSGNNFSISNNVTNCNSAAEVITECSPTCPTGSVTLSTQAEVNQFLIDYPSCTEIQGNLLIGDWSSSTGINDISALQNITAVNGELAIANTSLTNVNDLTALTEVNGGLSIYFNPLITSLDGFVNLTTFAGPLAIDDNGVLASLSGIDNIDTTSINYLSLNYNQTLSICNVASICTYLSDSGNNFSISNNVTNCNSAAEVITECSPTCPTGDVTFTSQTEVNQFLIDYPSCTEIQGNLLIGDWSSSTGINDISALQNITAVNGEFAIANTSLTNVNDLTALTEVNGGLSIYFNPLITSLDGFVNLTTFAGPLAIDDNGVLASLSGIDNIDTTSINYLSLNYNQTLSICNVASICTYLSDSGNNFSISNNVTNCNSAAEVITECSVDLCPPSGNYQFHSQAEVNQFIIDYPNCTEIDGILIIGGNNLSDITDLTALQNITHVTSITVQNTSLINLTQLNNLDTIDVYLNLQGNTLLVNINGLENLTTVGGVKIGNNPILENFNGLTNLTDVGDVNSTFQVFEIYNNDTLTSLGGFDSLVNIWTKVEIEQNSNLLSLDGLNSVVQFGHNSKIRSNELLQNLNGLENITSIADGLNILTNAALTSLSALSNLTTMNNSHIEISGNNTLTTLSGLDNIDPTSIVGLWLQSSQNLTTCNVTSICDYLSNGGSATISGNAVGCNNQTEIEDACGGFPDCPPGDITFTSQVEVDQFIIDYPNCTTIQGNLLIGDGLGFVNINDVSPLQNITTVLGALYIQGTNLTDIDELSSLTGINGELWIYFNPLITSLDGLINLTDIGNLELIIQGNDVLASLAGLDNIDPETINNISIESNVNLSVCNVLSICTFITTLENESGIHFTNNATGCNITQEVQDSCIGILPQCPSGNVQFLSQAEVDHFSVQYPNCTQFPGYLRIGGTSQNDISDLSPFEDVISVAGYLVVTETSLTNLQGLNNLTTVNGSFEIVYNEHITSLSGVNNLSTVVGGITFLGNPSLSTLVGLGSVNYTESLNIITNNSLINLEGLNFLSSVSTNGGTVDISSNASLESLDGLDLLAHGSLFKIRNNPSLTSLSGLVSLEDPVGITISNNDSLTAIGSLPNLTSVESNFNIIGNSVLASLEGLNNLVTTGQLNISNNDSLTNLEGLDSLEEILWILGVHNNDNLLSLDGLESLTSIGDTIEIQSNSLLNNLETLSPITGLLSNVTINYNDALTNLFGLHNIVTIGGNTPGRLIIQENPALVDLTDLSSLESLFTSGALHIINNANLTSLQGLNNIDPNTMTYLQLESSINLTTCAVESICTYLSNGGVADISGNATGCSSQVEIEDECALIGVNDFAIEDRLIVYPNPFNDWLNIETINNTQIEKINLFDITGKQLITLKVDSTTNITRIPLSNLSKGLYFINIHTNKGLVTQKITK